MVGWMPGSMQGSMQEGVCRAVSIIQACLSTVDQMGSMSTAVVTPRGQKDSILSYGVVIEFAVLTSGLNGPRVQGVAPCQLQEDDRPD